MEEYLNEHRNKVNDFHNNANCKYDGKDYVFHLDMVVDGIMKYETVFLKHDDYRVAIIGGYYHDTIEDAQLTFNDIMEASNKAVARLVLDVTDVHEENRLLRHLFTMGKTVKDYRSIIVKMADMRANGLYSKTNGSSMYKKYVEEYQYRKPIFKKALSWYEERLDQETLKDFWAELDWIHDGEIRLEPKSKFDLIYFKNYVNTYTKTGPGGGCDNDGVIVKDLLYGIGVALDGEEYRYADGYEKFLKHIKQIHG